MMFGLYPETIKILNEIFSNYENIDEVIIYGSRAKGNYREGSDIDLTIKGKLDRYDLGSIMTDIDDSLIPYLVDISDYDTLSNQDLKDHINRVGQVFYKKET